MLYKRHFKICAQWAHLNYSLFVIHYSLFIICRGFRQIIKADKRSLSAFFYTNGESCRSFCRKVSY